MKKEKTSLLSKHWRFPYYTRLLFGAIVIVTMIAHLGWGGVTTTAAFLIIATVWSCTKIVVEAIEAIGALIVGRELEKIDLDVGNDDEK